MKLKYIANKTAKIASQRLIPWIIISYVLSLAAIVISILDSFSNKY